MVALPLLRGHLSASLQIDGYTYERRAIERWLCSNRTSPLTGLPLKSLRLTPNRSLKAAIEHWVRCPERAY